MRKNLTKRKNNTKQNKSIQRDYVNQLATSGRVHATKKKKKKKNRLNSGIKNRPILFNRLKRASHHCAKKMHKIINIDNNMQE